MGTANRAASAEAHAHAPGLVVSRFTTDALDPRHRHEAWRNQNWPSLAPTFDSRPEPDFYARAETLALGSLAVTYGRFGAQTISRTPERLRAAPADHLSICMIVEGALDGDWGRLRPGEAGICDLGRPWQHRSSECRLITFSVAREEAVALGIDASAVHGLHLRGPTAALLRSHLLTVHEVAQATDPGNGPLLAQTVTDLLVVGMAEAGCDLVPRPDATLAVARLRAERLIVGALGRPELGVPWLCRELGLSRSALYRLFEADGGVEQRIRRERLHATRLALAAGNERIADIAERYGFCDQGHFSRSFRAEFGLSPRDYRARAAADPKGD